MAGVMALQNFDHDGARKRGDFFEVSDQVAQRLKTRGLVLIDGEAHPSRPMKATGEKPSVLPVVQVLPQTIVKKLKHGAKPKKAAQ
jgi:hypothetical protein